MREERKSLDHSSALTFARRTEVLSGQWPTWMGFGPVSPNSPKEGFKIQGIIMEISSSIVPTRIEAEYG
jgi:hypothetical protein